MSTISSLPLKGLGSGPIDLTTVEPDGDYEVVNGKVAEKPARGVYETHIASDLMWLLGHFIRTNRIGHLVAEMLFLIRSGVRSVWVVYPAAELELVYVYESSTSVRILTRSDRLELPGILPGFQLRLDSLFEPPAASVISQDTV
jgi:hypothetical protein